MPARRVTVTNLATLQEFTYFNDLSIKKNVLNAYMQMERKDYHWWGCNRDFIAKTRPPIVESDKTVSCGDWCAVK